MTDRDAAAAIDFDSEGAAAMIVTRRPTLVSSVEVQAARTAGKAAVRLGCQLMEVSRRGELLQAARPTIPVAVADGLLNEFSATETVGLDAYLDSPDFEHLAVQLVVVARVHRSQKWQEEVRSGVREAIRQGIRHVAGISGDLLLPTTDLVFDALVVACQRASAEIAGSHADPVVLASASHLGALAARNGRLLAKVKSLAAFHELASRLRSQVTELQGGMRLPHIGLVSPVAWDRLYVDPVLVEERHDARGFTYSDAVRNPTEDDTRIEQPESAIGRLATPGQRVVIPGDPGAGKSTLAAKLAYDFAAADSFLVPFLVVLRDLSEALKSTRRRLVDHLAATSHDPYNVDLDPDAVEYLLLNGRAVVILDGLDELTDVTLRQRVVQLTESFAVLYPLVPMVVTSRRIGYADAPLKPSLFRSWRIVSFDEARVEAYTAKWFALDEGAAPRDRDRLRTAFLRESVVVEDLRRSPLLLSLLCALYSAERYIPRYRAQVYEKCALMVFDRWDAMRGIQMPMQFHGHVRSAVQNLAWQMLALGDATELPRARVLQILIKYLRAKGHDHDEAEGLAEQFLAFCAGRTWVLAEVGATGMEPIYGFAHRTFLEYFAAEHLVRHHPTPQDVWSVLEPQIRRGSWEVIAQLAVQLLERNRADGAAALLGLVLDALPGAEPPTRLALTAFMARVCGGVMVSPALVNQIVEAALAAASTLAVTERARFWTGTSWQMQAQRTDLPLHTLMYDSLDSNLGYVRRALADKLGERVVAGDDLALYLVDHLSRAYVVSDKAVVAVWEDLRRELQARYEPELGAWRTRHPWTWPSRRSVEETVDEFGAAPLYVGDFVLTGSTLPEVLYLANDGTLPGYEPPASTTARRLRQRLLKLPTPWLPATTWWAQLPSDLRCQEFEVLERARWPRSGQSLATYLVLLLPYLETIADRDVFLAYPSEPLMALIANRRPRNDRAVGRPRLLRQRIPQDCWDFLVRWSRREFSVVG